jgi:hypothetical protein
MTEPTIVCPKCRNEIKLTESLAAPLLEATRAEYARRMREKDDAIAAREADVRARTDALAQAEQTLDQRAADEVERGRAKIAADEARKAKLIVATDLDQKDKELAELREVLVARDGKLAEAQKAQAELARKERALEDARRELDLTVETRVQAAREADREVLRAQVRAEARPEIDELKLKLQEHEQKNLSLHRTIEELQRKAEQGSQQLQGEAQEVELEAMLSARFPRDAIEPVAKGERGADVLQRVLGPGGQACGAILWESKRTKNWSDGWLVKLKDDQRAVKAETCVLVSHALPKGVEAFGLVEDVWVTHPRTAVALAIVLRQTLIELASARQAGVGRETKMEMMYQYLTGPRFRQRVQAMVDAFRAMQEDLDSEKRAIMKQWSKREAQIERMMQGTVGMYGDLQAIAGKSLQEIEGLEMRTLSLPFEADPTTAK